MATKNESWLHNHPTSFHSNRLIASFPFGFLFIPCHSRASLISFFLSLSPSTTDPSLFPSSSLFWCRAITFKPNTNRILFRTKSMAACDSLKHIFESPVPEKPALLESLSSPWNHMKPVKPIDQPSFVEIFGELHFKEKSQSFPSSSASFPMSSSSSSSSSSLDLYPQSCYGLDPENKKSPSLDSILGNPTVKYSSNGHKNSDSFSSMNSESLQLCTEGLGFESFDDVGDLKSELNEDWQNQEKKVSITKYSPTENLSGEFRRSKTPGSAFPPPISCIGKTGKPWVCFKSYRQDGRFVLKEVRMPSQEFLHACREGGRLKLQFVQPSEDILELEEEDYEEDEDEDEQGEYEEIDDVAEEERAADSIGN